MVAILVYPSTMVPINFERASDDTTERAFTRGTKKRSEALYAIIQITRGIIKRQSASANKNSEVTA